MLTLVVTVPFVAVATVGLVPDVALAGDEDSGSRPMHVRAAKVTLDVPERWRPLDLTKKDLKAITEAVEEQNPELAETYAPSQARALKFYAQDLVDGDSVEVLVLPGLWPSKSIFEQTLQDFFRELPGFELVSVNRLKVGSSKALRAQFRFEITTLAGDVLPVYQDRLVVKRGDFELVLVTVNVDDEPADIRIADGVVRSVRPLGTKGAATPTTSSATLATKSATPSAEPLLVAPTGLVLYVVPGSCSETECGVSARITNNSSDATKFRFYREGGGPVGPSVTPPTAPTPGAVIDFGPPGVPTPVGIRFCVYAVAIDAAGRHSAPSNAVCFALTPQSSGDLV